LDQREPVGKNPAYQEENLLSKKRTSVLDGLLVTGEPIAKAMSMEPPITYEITRILGILSY